MAKLPFGNPELLYFFHDKTRPDVPAVLINWASPTPVGSLTFKVCGPVSKSIIIAFFLLVQLLV